jgi:outer membrane protein OmpA-like peptidoglycan-associated protein
VVQLVVPSSETPRLEHKGYNRGLILGLTMAESMLLLVFCLLLVAAALITTERNHRYEAEKKLQAAEQRVAELEKENAAVATRLVQLQSRIGPDAVMNQATGTSTNTGTVSAADRENAQKEWRELVSTRQVLDDLKANGLQTSDLPGLAAVASMLRRQGIDMANLPGEIRRMVEGGAAAPIQGHDWPPIINLSEAGGYYFQSGSAELTPPFAQKLDTTISDEIADNLSRYQVDIVEVIGHTDEQPVARGTSNLDKTFIDVMDGKAPIAALEPADNAGLGLARAIAVANVLKANPKLKDATVLPMSAAQLILPGDTVTLGQGGNVENRRRIEIRIRRRAQTLSP